MILEKDFSAINAKIQAMSAKLASDKDFINMAHKDSLEEIIDYLKNNLEIGEYFTGYENIYEVSSFLEKYREDKLKKLSHYLDSSYKEFAKFILEEYENTNIKRVLRSLQRSEDNVISKFNRELSIGDKTYNIDLDYSIPAFIEKIKDTKYYHVLKPYEDRSSDVILFYMEMNLDRLYYTDLMEASKNFSKHNKKILKEILGRKIDLLNIIWLYRSYKFYKLLPEERINFCVFAGYEFSYEDLRDLCYTEEMDKFIEKIKKSSYGFLFEGENTDLFLNRRADRYLYYLAKKYMHKNKNDIGKYLSFVLLLNFQIKDISALMESIRYNLTFDQTIKYMIRKIEEVRIW